MPSCHKADAAARCVAAVWIEVGCYNNLWEHFHADRLEARVLESLSVTSRCQEQIWESSSEKEASWSLLIEPEWMWHGLAVSGRQALASVRNPCLKPGTCKSSRTSLTATFLSQVSLSGQMSLSLVFHKCIVLSMVSIKNWPSIFFLSKKKQSFYWCMKFENFIKCILTIFIQYSQTVP